MISPLKDLLTTAVVARKIGKQRDTVNRAVRDGKLRPYAQLPTLGAKNGAYLFELSEVERWRDSLRGGGYAS